MKYLRTKEPEMKKNGMYLYLKRMPLAVNWKGRKCQREAAQTKGIDSH